MYCILFLCHHPPILSFTAVYLGPIVSYNIQISNNVKILYWKKKIYFYFVIQLLIYLLAAGDFEQQREIKWADLNGKADV